jgi:hypothetical protein
LILGKNLTTTGAKQLGLKDLAKTLCAHIFLPDMFDIYKRRKGFSFHLAIFERAIF